MAIKYEIKKQIGSISESDNGWVKELNLVSWNDREPVYDLRAWSADHEGMRKGITLSATELKNLRDLINKIEL